jgi:NMD protein affecting ribosome stability and mRNA decay
MHADYFEGILQLRNPTEEVKTFVERHDEDFSRVKKARNGFDYYFRSQRKLRALGTTLQKRFPGELKTSRKLHTRNRQTGKAVYRVTVLFRSYPIRKGQIIKVRGNELKILTYGKKVYVQDTETGKKRWMAYDKLPSP